MPVQPSSHPLIPAEINAEMTPAVRAFVHALIAGFQSQINVLQSQIVDLNAKIVDLESQVKKLTPQNSSVPPSSVHPHGKPPRNKPKSGKNRSGRQGTLATNAYWSLWIRVIRSSYWHPRYADAAKNRCLVSPSR